MNNLSDSDGYQYDLPADVLIERSEALLRQCRICRHLISIQEITYLQIYIDEDVECRRVEQGDRAFIIFKDEGRCTLHAPRLTLIKGGQA
jgi:hypothetical protein